MYTHQVTVPWWKLIFYHLFGTRYIYQDGDFTLVYLRWKDKIVVLDVLEADDE